jgi:NTP pyrophosphatase (non-canonical NTP hydrolase)
MNELVIAQLLDLVYRKNQLDQLGNWSNGSSTYLVEIRKELAEVEDELELDRQCYLEDELGDILWDYLNILQCLKTERDISIDRVFSRAVTKYDERISGIEQGGSWTDVKIIQKARLSRESMGDKKSKDPTGMP